ncbi:MAG: hypothetical protein GY716_15945 [bacterium]|nr:hypothetical protein [bacterium]
MKRYPRELVDVFRGFIPTGSRYYGTHTERSDHDWLCLGSRVAAARLELDGHEPRPDGSCTGLPQFTSLRFDQVNVIVAHCEEFYDKFLRASAVCRVVQPASRAECVVIFRAILYSETPE